MRGAAKVRGFADQGPWTREPLLDVDQCIGPALQRLCGMSELSAAAELRQRIADYRRLRAITIDKQAIKAIESIVAEAEEQLKQVEQQTRDQAR